MSRLLLLLLLQAIGLPAAGAQVAGTATISGRTVGADGAPLAGVAVTLLTPAGEVVRAVASGVDGSFRMTGVAAGGYLLRARLLGHTPWEEVLEVAAGDAHAVEVRMEIAAVEIEGVEVRADRDELRERSRFEAEAGVTARVVGGEDLRRVPGLAEADVMRVVELFPGVVSTSDFSSAFNVRGGSADQNLILLDGFPIFNPFHLGGLFSVFNADVVGRAELLAGGFGAEHGGRVSSVLNVESAAAADTSGLRALGGVSLLSSRLTLQSGLPAGIGTMLGGSGGSWYLAGRRSYFDVLLRPVFDFPYHLTDAQGQLSIGTVNDGRLRFTVYTGDDVLDLSTFDGGDGGASVLRLDWRWGNDVVGAHWSQPIGGGWIADSRLGFSRYRDALSLLDFDDTRFASGISQLFARGEVSRGFATMSLRAGAEIARLRYDNQAEAGGATFLSQAGEGIATAAFLSTRWRPTRPWIVESGLRLDAWAPAGASIATVSPRFAAKRFLGADENVALKLAVGRYTQVLHSLRNEEFPLSNDLWIAASEDVPHVVSDQVQGGVEAFLPGDWQLSAEAYLRSARGIVELNPADDPNDPTDDLLAGHARAHGLDLLARRRSGRISGWASLSLLRAERRLPDVLRGHGVGPSAEARFPPHWDRRVSLHLVLLAELPRGLDGSIRWTYGSGLPYTRPVAQHLVWDYDLDSGRYRVPARPFAEDEPSLFVVLGDRNAERYPAYHRLDATLRRTFRPGGSTVTPYLQVLNLYNRRNVMFFFYNFDRSPPTRSGISMFPVLPTIGVEVAF